MASVNQYIAWLQVPSVRAFLDVVAWAEGADYNTLYGGGTFNDFSRHPNRAITAGGYTSTAAGRYQFLNGTWKGIANRLGLSDFSPGNQDIAALALIDERNSLSYLLNGDVLGTLKHLGCAWASLPYSRCGQNERSLSSVTSYFANALAVYNGGNYVTPIGDVQPIIIDVPDVDTVLNSNLMNQILPYGQLGNGNNNAILYAAAGLFLVIVLTR